MDTFSIKEQKLLNENICHFLFELGNVLDHDKNELGAVVAVKKVSSPAKWFKLLNKAAA